MEKRLIDANDLYIPSEETISAMVIASAPTVLTIPENPTNGDMIKAMFPDVEIEEIIGSFDPVKRKLLGYRTWLGGRSQDYCLDWWNAPYRGGQEDADSN